jgi:uncharacterized protein YyaL (SSP411 family)
MRAIDVVAVGPKADEFAAQALALPFTGRVVMRAARPDDLPPGHPGRSVSLTEGQTVALVCTGQRCSLPITDPQQLGTVVDTMSVGATA